MRESLLFPHFELFVSRSMCGKRKKMPDCRFYLFLLSSINLIRGTMHSQSTTDSCTVRTWHGTSLVYGPQA